MRKSIHEKEDISYNKWLAHYEKLGIAESLCFDGLCYNGELYNDDYNCHIGNEEELWNSASRKILFLMKDTNGNPDDDYREWPWHIITRKFFKVIFSWLNGLSEMNESSYPKANGQYNKKYPLAIVNLKKLAGNSSVSDSTVWKYASQDKDLLKEQVVDILKPNIVVCGGGGNSTVLNIAKDLLYPEYEFEKVNNWCYYNKQEDLLLINSYHPTARVSDEEKYDGFFEALIDFTNKNSLPSKEKPKS